MAVTKMVDPFDGYNLVFGAKVSLVDAQAGSGVTLITDGEAAGLILSLKKILLSPSGQNTISILDTDGVVLLPSLSFDTAGGVVDNFLRGELQATPEKGIVLKATAAAGVTAIVSVWTRSLPDVT